MRAGKRIGFLLILFLVVAFVAWSQDTANIVGTVTDASGSAIPNAKVTVSNPDKGYVRVLETNSAGDYIAAKVPLGDYVIAAEATGFEKFVRSSITLAVGQTQRVDFQMKVGQVSQEVTVTGNVPHVETETATISNVVTGAQITDLDLNGRSFISLYSLAPGVVDDNSFTPGGGGLPFRAFQSINGNRMEYNNVELDGATNLDEGAGGSALAALPSVDSIAEFRISTSNYTADMGRHAAATIEVATKSGTRDFHGSAWEFVRNDQFDANDWFANRKINPPGGNAPKTPLKWNTFGYNFGGPFYIPGHYNTSKSKTFFFWTEEWRRYRQGTVLDKRLPTLRMRQGDFSECDPASPNFNTAAASGCRLPTVNGVTTDIVPIDPNAKALVDAYIPLPNNGVNHYVAAHSRRTDSRQEQIRVDQNISNKTALFVRYTHDIWTLERIPPEWTTSDYDTVTSIRTSLRPNAVLHLTHTFKPNLMAEFVMGYTDNSIHFVFPPVGSSSIAGSIRKPSTWTANNLFPPNANNPLLPAIFVHGGLGFRSAEDPGPRPWFNSVPTYSWKYNMAYTPGKHTLKFGFFLQKYQKNEQFGADTEGTMYFLNSATNTTGNALADMFLGRIAQYTEGTTTVNGVPVGGYPKGHWRYTDFEPYLQDDWKISRKLTLNLGLRYYYFTPFHDVSRPQTVDSTFLPNLYDPAQEAQLDASGNLIAGSGHDFTSFGNGLMECGSGGIAAGCMLTSHRTPAPRVGFAFDPTGAGKTVIRGGYGFYFEIGNGDESNTEGLEGNPPVALAPTGYNITGYQNIVPGANGPPTISTLPYHQKWPSVQQFSLGVQHEFPGNNLLSLSYVGSLGRHLATERNLDQVPVGISTANAPALKGLVGTNSGTPSQGIPGELGLPLCDAAGNCDVQTTLIYNEAPSIYFVPYRGYSAIWMKQNTAVSNYNSLQVSFRHAFSHGLIFQGSYTWSHAIDDSTSTYFGTGVDDNYQLSRWRATSDLNRSQVLVMNYIYDLPFFKHASSSLLRSALGGWEISGITSFFTGEPVDIYCGINGLSTGLGYSATRCNSLGPLKIKKGVYNDPEFGPTPTWFDLSVLGQPTFDQLLANGQSGMFGYMGRNSLTGPGRNNWDMALLKNFQLPWFKGENSTLQFRFETFNTFNHPQWQYVNAACDGATPPGQPCTGTNNIGNNEVASAWLPRIIQLALKFRF
jgi:carboxypeptidase family protein